jgi:transcriptional regulator with XRE-family HTH domain
MGLTTSRPSRPRRRTAKEHGPDPIDVGVGRQVRLARELAHMTQVDVGSRLGMSFQLVQKYEQGEIRVSASRLYHLAALLQKPINFFFAAAEKGQALPLPERLGERESELVQAYRKIANPEVKERLCQLVKGMTRELSETVQKGRAKSSR